MKGPELWICVCEHPTLCDGLVRLFTQTFTGRP